MQGVASRGRLKGQAVPGYGPVSTPPVDLRSSVPQHDQERHDSVISSSQVFSKLPLEAVPHDTLTMQLGTVSNHSPLVCSVLVERSAQRLLHHYRCLVSCRLPWIDSIDNPWRSIILPLAMESPSLFFAVLSMAAEDLALQLNDASIPNGFSRDSKLYRERAMVLLTSDFANELTATSINSLSPKSITSVLAATLVLCNLEIKQPHSTLWRIHLRAARAIIHRFLTDNSLIPTSAMNAFLIQKFFSIHVFASMSTFGDTRDLTNDMLKDQCNSVFLEFLKIMQEITHARSHLSNSHCHGLPVSVDCRALRSKLGRARERTLLCSEAPTANSQTTRCDLENIAGMFYYAGLIYGHRALHLQCCLDNFKTWRDKIVEQLNSLNDPENVCQDLLWPLFIAGTETNPSEFAQEFLVNKIRQVMKLSGHWNGLGALKFLEELWESGNAGPTTWIDLARDRARQGYGLMVI